jgi:hypothetical protein
MMLESMCSIVMEVFLSSKLKGAGSSALLSRAPPPPQAKSALVRLEARVRSGYFVSLLMEFPLVLAFSKLFRSRTVSPACEFNLVA